MLEDDAIEPTSRRTYHNPVFGGLAIEHPYNLRYETNCTLGFGFAALGFYEELPLKVFWAALTAGHCRETGSMWLQGGARSDRSSGGTSATDAERTSR